ncbi:MAG: hypothetical protein H6710_19475 [Myxococcales bacterium]|nr:hypothetical protein [Myxococcales bacterium]MCB9702316.1 hypothetical protein [Myxococcales bacterium]
MALALLMIPACAGEDGGSGGSGGSTSQASGEDASSGTSGSSGAEASSSGGASGEGTSTGEGTTQGACELDVDLAVLSDHLGALATMAGALHNEVGAGTGGGFLAAPGLGELSEVLTITLKEPCAGADALDPVCEGASCGQLVCSGDGAGWSFNAWLDAIPTQAGDFTFSELSVVVSWVDGADEVSFQILSKATRGPESWSVSANGTIQGGAFEIVALLPELIDGAETVLVASGGGGAFSGQLEVNGVDVALVGDGAGMTPTGACW